ncbi:Stealth-like protein [Krasilnikovia cinnamomea]|uniref:Stealth-like protein n=1 Tax=Krasilnikovia cinnamomea TaxID=349313 RepID=A0A4Q7ZHR1_9ACTN|nr:stealth family protein [Krasilnikovia cinnamomea]RZU49763.1 Stealth-like protein [Krasilnikovia cinnamomea]
MPLRRILRLAPWRVRKRIFTSVQDRLLPRVAAHRRLHVARRIVPLSPPPRLPTMRVTPDTPSMRVRTGQGWITARRERAASPASVRRDNLTRVTAALTGADVDWFRVPTRDVRRTAVAVPAAERDRVVALLEGLTATGDGLLEVVAPARRAERRPHSGERRRRGADVLRVCWPVTDPTGSLLLGTDLGCEIEFWRESDGHLTGPRDNPIADVIKVDEPVTTAPEAAFGPFSAASDHTRYRTREVFTLADPDRISFPIDVVYTWVDGDDPAWRARKAEALRGNPWVTDVNGQTANDSRYACRDELRYSLRALHCFAPWVRHVFIVTDDQVPSWLDMDHPGITVVDHREIFGDTGRLPTFNSQAIESRLHRIPGLSEHFLYLNDDVFLGRPVTPDLFFTPGGLTRFFPSSAQVDSGPRSSADAPVNSAGKNNRRLIREAFGRVLTRKMLHTPHPSRLSVLTEIEQRFAEYVTATAEHQFRHPEDIALLSSLQQYYAYLTGRAVPGEVRYRYADLADPATPFKLASLLRHRHLDAFCLNDTDSDPEVAAEQAGLVADFLPAYLPFVSPYELAEPRPATVSLSRLHPAPPVVARQATRAVAGTGGPRPAGDVPLPSSP